MQLTQEELFTALGILINKIEECGASTKLTDAVTLASDIRRSVGNEWNQPDEFATKRIQKTLLSKVMRELREEVKKGGNVR